MNQTDRIFAEVPGVPAVLVERHTTIVKNIPVRLIVDPLNPMRHDMNDVLLSELMDDIRRNGLLQNLCVVPVMGKERVRIDNPTQQSLTRHEDSGGWYRVAAGHRRLRACRAINLAEVMCKVFCDTDQTEQELMHTENMKREEVTDYDLAIMYAEWCKEPGITEAALVKRAGKSPEFVYARIELLSGYKEVAEALHERKIKFSVARALNRADEPEFMLMWLQMAIDQGASSKLVNAWVSERKAHKDMTVPTGPVGAPHISVAAPAMQKIECLLCGDAQSYNLRTVLLCVSDVDRLREARAAVEAAPQEMEDSEVSK